jgi:hypothetical protein
MTNFVKLSLSGGCDADPLINSGHNSNSYHLERLVSKHLKVICRNNCVVNTFHRSLIHNTIQSTKAY